MKIGLIDVDGHNFPNLPLMKLSAWHKAHGDSVEWYEPLFSAHMDKVYMSKVFSFTPDYQYYIDADEVARGGSGYCIETIGLGREVYRSEKDSQLPPDIEHIYPDYSLYPEKTGYGKPLKEQTAYGFLTRGCPRGCEFCHVEAKEGRCSHKVADLSEFWKGQGNIMICDPNLIACKDWKDLVQQLIDSKAVININQGVDIRMMTEEKAEMIKRLRVDSVHFAWDRYEDKDIIIPKFKAFKEITGWRARKTSVFVLTNFNTTFEQDLERVYTLRDMDYDPYIMIYNKQLTKGNEPVRLLQRYVNNRKIFKTTKRFEDYNPKMG